MLEHHDGAGIADRRFQQALGVGGRCGRHDLEARHLCEQSRVAAALRAGGTRNPAVGSAKDDRHRRRCRPTDNASRPPSSRLLEGLECAGPRRELDDGLQPRQRRADGKAGERILERGRGDDASRAELVEKPWLTFWRAAVLRDVDADQKHVGIAAHLLGQRIAQRLAIGEVLHVSSPAAPHARTARQAGAGRTAGRDLRVPGGSAAGWRVVVPSPRRE